MPAFIRSLCAGLVLAGAIVAAPEGRAATLTPEIQKAVRGATFEVVLRKAEKDPLRYEKELPLDLIPYAIRTDHYWPVGTAFSLGDDRYVSAAHVFSAAVGSQFGAPGLRDSEGHFYPVDKVLRYSAHEDFVVFSIVGKPTGSPLPVNLHADIDEPVFAVGNALGEGIIIRDGLLTSLTPESQDGRWKWLRFSAAASPGNSGGPLLDAAGRVIGVVIAKSPGENLNYALPIANVQAGSDSAGVIDVRYSSGLPIMRARQEASLKARITLPQTFPDFATALQGVLLDASARDRKDLLASAADKLYPKGSSAKLLASTYYSTNPAIAHEGDDDAWTVDEPDSLVSQDLPGKGKVSTGNSLGIKVFHIEMPPPPEPAKGPVAWDSRSFMDALLVGLHLTRAVGDQQIRVLSLGKAQDDRVVTDAQGRRWRASAWPMGYQDSFVIAYTLAVPDGYVGMVGIVTSAQRHIEIEHLRFLTGYLHFSLSGNLAQWNAYLADPEVRPELFGNIHIAADDKSGVQYASRRLTLGIAGDVLQTTPRSVLVLHMAYLPDAQGTRWEVAGMQCFRDEQRKTYVRLDRHEKPAADAPRDLLDAWHSMANRQAGFNGVPGHDDQYKQYWIRDIVGAPYAKGPGLDPDATVLYEATIGTEMDLYPRDLMEHQRRLVQAIHVLER